MVDFLSKAERSVRMAAIKGRNNKTTERALASLFRQNQITGWRRHLPLPGRPDFAFKKQKVAIFIDGCFWHGCPTHYKKPSSNRAFWQLKVESNRARDLRVNRELRAKGWRVLRIWECDLARANATRTVRRVLRALA